MSETPQANEVKVPLKVVQSSQTLDDDVITNILEHVDDEMKYLFVWQYLTVFLAKEYDTEKLKEIIDALS